jgi:hypothetical protein
MGFGFAFPIDTDFFPVIQRAVFNPREFEGQTKGDGVEGVTSSLLSRCRLAISQITELDRKRKIFLSCLDSD